MKRKVIKQGHNTLTVTLPTKWAKKQGIEAGDEIDLLEKDSSLVISGKPILEKTVKELDVKGMSIPVLWRSIISAYRAGYDEIKIYFDPPKGKKNIYTDFGYNNLKWLFPKGMLQLSQIEAAQALIGRLIGMEIVDQKGKYCIAKEMGETTYSEFDDALRRIFLLLISIAEEVYEGYKNRKMTMLKSSLLIDSTIDRFEDFCLRVLNKKGYSDPKKTSTMYALIFLLEMVGDEYKKIAMHVLNTKEKPSKLMFKEFEVQQNQLKRFYKFFYSYSKDAANEIYAEDEKGDTFLNQFYAQFSTEEKNMVHHFKKIGIYILSLTELRIDLEH
ncbi:MAG: AbrB/MazE/SpoVT family DNA-binding domain-containing protein [archaeon]